MTNVQTKSLEEYRKPIVTETIENIQRTRYEEQERKRAKLLQVDQFPVLIGWLSAVGVGFATSAIISFNGITSVAPLVGLTFSWMAMLFFGFIELMYLVFLVAYLVLESRGEKTGGTLVGLWFFAGVAILSNFYHTLTYHEFNIASPELWAGVVLSVSAPVAVLSVSKLASRVLFSRAVKIE